eukprot:SAG31_NODE_981_length_10558_cov_2.972273_5_plen_170_part_00
MSITLAEGTKSSRCPAATAVAEQVPRLAQHFMAGGGPVMAGGLDVSGAFTILGVAWDGSEDQLAKRSTNGSAEGPWFLVLDPHYMGSHDRSAIQHGGGCKWHPRSFWRSGVQRYLCLGTQAASVVADAGAPMHVETVSADSDCWTVELVSAGYDGNVDESGTVAGHKSA